MSKSRRQFASLRLVGKVKDFRRYFDGLKQQGQQGLVIDLVKGKLCKR